MIISPKLVLRSAVMALAFTTAAHADSAIDVPVHHQTYASLERLSALGLTDAFGLTSQPLTRMQVARILQGAVGRVQDGSYSPSLDAYTSNYEVESLLYDLIEEYRPELVRLGVDVVDTGDGPAQRSSVTWLDGVTSRIAMAGLEGGRTILRENERGWRLKDGLNTRKEAHGWFRWGEHVTGDIRPGIRSTDGEYEFEIELATLTVNIANVLVHAGRQSLWWGPGHHGSLLMTDNAFGIPMVRVQNDRPFQLPWKFADLGVWNYQFFVGKLSEDRVIPNTLIGGQRVEHQPAWFQALQMGFSHAILFGGDGGDIPGVVDLIDLTKAGGAEEGVNHLVSVDGKLDLGWITEWLPVANGFVLYGEFGAEDESGNLPTDIAFIVGALLPDIFRLAGLDLRVEFARTSSIWYEHFKHRTGYTYRGEIIGHHIGGDAEDLYVGLTRSFNDRLVGSVGFDIERRGLSLAAIETIAQVELSMTYQYREDMVLEATVEVQITKNAGNIVSEAEGDQAFVISVRRTF